MKSIKAIQGGRHARINGQNFERLIDMACQRYKEDGVAWIEKTPEPMKPLGKQNGRGQFLACYTKQAQPDYKGTLRGGRTVVFEAKHTDADRIERSRLTDEQLEALRAHESLGAYCFILVSFKFEKFYRVPFHAWDHMKFTYGKVSVNEKDIAEFLLRGGIMDFLGQTDVKEKRGAPEAFSTLKRQTAGQRIREEAAERQVPKRVRETGIEWNKCPTCGHVFARQERPHFCETCGQALYWPDKMEAEMQIPKRVRKTGSGWKQCPTCGHVFYHRRRPNFCETCGQAIEWPE